MSKVYSEVKARECIKNVFHDCKFLYLVHSSQVTLQKNTNKILIKGKPTNITASRTVKTAIKNKKRCISCGGESSYVAVVKNINTSRENVIFLIDNDLGDRFVPLTKDHIIPKARGGTDTFKNLQCMCLDCNSEKADNVVDANTESNTIMIYRDHYDSLVSKQKDFSLTRKRIKEVIQKLPWYMKLLGVHKLLEVRLKEPLDERGYYQSGKPVDNNHE